MTTTVETQLPRLASSARERPSLGLRMRVALRRRALIRRLAEGADPAASAELGLCAERLLAPRRGAGLAASLERVVDAAEEPVRPAAASVPLAREQSIAERPLLLGLAADLRSADPARARGVAMVERLLTDGNSRLYLCSDGESLKQPLRHARSALLA